MNRKFFTSCHRVVTCSTYSRPLFTSRLFGLSRVNGLPVNTGFRDIINLDIKTDGNQRLNQILKYTSSLQPKPKDAPPKPEDEIDASNDVEALKKLSLFQRFRAMYRDYWYVLIPVHVVTSIGWFVGFYYVAESGVDLVTLAERIHLSESLTDKLRHGSHSVTGYLAIAYALYKIATPIRYTVTLGGTTLTINYLKKFGYIKPMPKKDELKKLYQNKKETLKERRDEMKAYVSEKLSSKKNP